MRAPAFENILNYYLLLVLGKVIILYQDITAKSIYYTADSQNIEQCLLDVTLTYAKISKFTAFLLFQICFSEKKLLFIKIIYIGTK